MKPTLLRIYREKRDFTLTSEPRGKSRKRQQTKSLSFVVQKHQSYQLHYDFRLEVQGILKSWAVPKGIPNAKKLKRLAVMAEDHPYEYRNFKGRIPAGQYGAGFVDIFDQGTYEHAELQDQIQQEDKILHDLHRGKLSFVLHGKKFQGTYVLLRIKTKENQWLIWKLM